MAQADAVIVPARLPLVTTVQSRNAEFDKDARLINAVAELEPVASEYIVENRPGLVEAEVYSGNCYGVYNWQGSAGQGAHARAVMLPVRR